MTNRGCARLWLHVEPGSASRESLRRSRGATGARRTAEGSDRQRQRASPGSPRDRRRSVHAAPQGITAFQHSLVADRPNRIKGLRLHRCAVARVKPSSTCSVPTWASSDVVPQLLLCPARAGPRKTSRAAVAFCRATGCQLRCRCVYRPSRAAAKPGMLDNVGGRTFGVVSTTASRSPADASDPAATPGLIERGEDRRAQRGAKQIPHRNGSSCAIRQCQGRQDARTQAKHNIGLRYNSAPVSERSRNFGFGRSTRPPDGTLIRGKVLFSFDFLRRP